MEQNQSAIGVQYEKKKQVSAGHYTNRVKRIKLLLLLYKIICSNRYENKLIVTVYD